MEIVKLLVAVIGGGGLVKLFNIFWSKKASEIKNLTDIINQMDRRIISQDLRILDLEKALGKKDRMIISSEQLNNRYERAFNKITLCEKDICPIWAMFNKLTKEEMG